MKNINWLQVAARIIMSPIIVPIMLPVLLFYGFVCLINMALYGTWDSPNDDCWY